MWLKFTQCPGCFHCQQVCCAVICCSILQVKHNTWMQLSSEIVSRCSADSLSFLLLFLSLKSALRFLKESHSITEGQWRILTNSWRALRHPAVTRFPSVKPLALTGKCHFQSFSFLSSFLFTPHFPCPQWVC